MVCKMEYYVIAIYVDILKLINPPPPSLSLPLPLSASPSAVSLSSVCRVNIYISNN